MKITSKCLFVNQETFRQSV